MTEANKVLKASSILVVSRVSERLLGLISTLILARLLIPEDFGVVAVSLLVITLLGVMSRTGSVQYIIQKDSVSDDDLNTAWTLDILLKCLLVMVLFVIAPFVADFYEDQRLTNVIRVLSTMTILAALANPELHIHKREQNYVTIFKIDILKKVISIASMVALALYLQNYWAMIIGHLVSNFVQLVASYVVLKYKPRFSLRSLSEQWAFSKWVLSKGLLGYFRGQADTFMVSYYLGLGSTGSYHVMKYISSMPASQFIQPALEPLLATFSRNKHDNQSLMYQVRLVFLVLSLLALPLTVFLYQFSLPIVDLLLGDNWIEYHELFGVISLLTVSTAIGTITSTVIMAKSKVKSLFYYDLVSLGATVAVLWSVREETVTVFAMCKVAIELLCVVCLSVYGFWGLKLIKDLGFFISITSLSLGSAILLSELLLNSFAWIDNAFVLLVVTFSSYLVGLSVVSYVAYVTYFNRRQEARRIGELIVSGWSRLRQAVNR